MINLNTFIGILFMVVSGIFDGMAFNSASKIWQSAAFSPQMGTMVKVFLFFNSSMIAFTLSLYFLQKQGMTNSLIFTLLWFGVTICGLAIMSGSFLQMSWLDKMITVGCIVLIGSLYIRGIAK